MKNSIDVNRCCGCEACRQVCPKGAIKIGENSEGFFYPSIDEGLCIDCGLCRKVCPLLSYDRLSLSKADCAIAAVHKDIEISSPSSSGGAWTAIAQVFCDKGYDIYGAVQNDDLSVEHKSISDIGEIGIFRKSKYIPSKMNDSFSEIREKLDRGRKVLFSGTPCQVGGLKLFLKREYDNLLLVDFSCHGVGSPRMFKRYIKEFGEKHGSKVVGYDFRHKARNLCVYSSTSSKIRLANGEEFTRFIDPWFKGFVEAYYKNECCYECPYTGLERISDITLADFWWVERVSKKFDAGKGVSLILANNEKGRSLIEGLEKFLVMEEHRLESCTPSNTALRHPVRRNPDTKKFLERLGRMSFDESVESLYPKRHLLLRVQFFLLKFVPSHYRWRVDRFLKKTKSGIKKFVGISGQ